jgi:hypothetical protein
LKVDPLDNVPNSIVIGKKASERMYKELKYLLTSLFIPIWKPWLSTAIQQSKILVANMVDRGSSLFGYFTAVASGADPVCL